MRQPTMYNEAPEPRIGAWKTRCRKCGWEEDESHLYKSDCEIEECPECGSDRVYDFNEDD